MPRARKPDPLFIGIGSHVVAIDASTGEIAWKTKLRSAMFVTLHREGKHLFAGAGGELYCLDPATGAILWHNKLKGLGTGLISFGGLDGVSASSAASAQMAAQAAALTAVIAAT